MPYKDHEVAKQKSDERWKNWAKRNPGRANARMREWRERNREYMLCASAKRRAAAKGVIFELMPADINIPESCPLALIPIHTRNDGTKGPCDNSPTLDRVDPSLGYVKGNVRVLSHRGNRWKNEMTLEDVKRLLDYMS